MLSKKTTFLAASLAAALALPAGAQASTIAYDGTTLIYTGSAAANNLLIYAAGDGSAKVDISDHEAIAAPDSCERLADDAELWRCPVPTRVKADMGDGADTFSPGSDFTAVIEADGGNGDDDLRGTDAGDILNGGPGNDKVKGYKGDDQLDGGDGDDTVDGGIDKDTVLGGSGNDNMAGDGFENAYADVVDGGPGLDTIDGDWTSREYDKVVTPLNVTLGGGADDGRNQGGEGDDVRNVERIHENIPGSYVGTDGPEEIVVRQVLDTVKIQGRGGDDVLKAADGADSVDGGAGNDVIDAGFGDDTIVGGPGKDRISADTAGGDCGPYWCKTDFGNDTIDVRDGEVDSVDCGAGTDTVTADADDVIAPNCESVNRAGAPKPDTGTPGNTGGKDNPRPTTKLAIRLGAVKLADARTRGLSVTVTAPGAGTVTVTAKKGSVVVGKVTKKVTKAGAVSLRVTPTKAAKRLKRNARIAITASFNGRSVAKASGKLR